MQIEKFFKKVLEGSPFVGDVYAVGGYVRDRCLGIVPKDLDIVVDGGRCSAFLDYLRSRVYIEPRRMGVSYPIWQVVFKDIYCVGGEFFELDEVVEFADVMRESYPLSDSRQRVVEVAAGISEDLMRRDFTVNMLLLDLASGEVVDLVGGRQDIASGILRCHPDADPFDIFSNDPLRILRLLRFHCRFGWEISPDVLEACRVMAPRLGIVSAERKSDELLRILKLDGLHRALLLLEDLGCLGAIFPSVAACVGVSHGDSPYHREGDVWVHTLMVVKEASLVGGVVLQLAALYHDTGKVATRVVCPDGKVTFYGHEALSAKIALEELSALKFPLDLALSVSNVVREHLVPRVLLHASDRAVWRFIRRVLGYPSGEVLLPLVLDIALCDTRGRVMDVMDDAEVEQFKAKVLEMASSVQPKVLCRPVLTGRRVMELLGVGPGPLVGKALRVLLEAQDEARGQGRELSVEEAEDVILGLF